MNWDSLRDMAGSRPRLAAVIGAVSLAGAGISAVVNGADVLDMVGGKAKTEQAALAEAQVREEKAMQAATTATEQRVAAQAELNAWSTALGVDTVAGYDFYLSAYPAGAYRQKAEAAKARLRAASAVLAPFSLDRLHPSVSTVVAAAREAARDAADKQTQAERLANMAAAAAGQARAHAPGASTVRYRDRDVYEGEVAGGKPQGLGVYVQGDAPYAGDRYQGQLSGGLWSGVGVYESASPGPQRPARYGGEVTNGHLSGSGVITRSDGARQAGAVIDGALNGHGVETRADGTRFEGEFKDGLPQGYGVLWSADGKVVESGRYEAGKLVQPLPL